MYQPSHEQAEEDRRLAYERGVPHGGPPSCAPDVILKLLQHHVKMHSWGKLINRACPIASPTQACHVGLHNGGTALSHDSAKTSCTHACLHNLLVFSQCF